MQTIAATAKRIRVAAVQPVPATDDRSLVDSIRAGDQGALADAYRMYGRAVYAAAFAVLRRRGPAEDVTQEVFVRLWNRADRYDASRGALVSFLRIDARGRAIDAVRSEKSRKNREERQARLASSDRAPGVEETVMNQVTFQRVRHLLEGLRPEERAPIALAYFDGHSYREVARLLGLPEGTVKSRIRTGMAHLKELLVGSGIESV